MTNVTILMAALFASLAIIAVLAPGAVLAQNMTANMTGGNMTGGNTTDTNQTGSISSGGGKPSVQDISS
jgi:hypothetical protein